MGVEHPYRVDLSLFVQGGANYMARELFYFLVISRRMEAGVTRSYEPTS
jgi:hypothetical protein